MHASRVTGVRQMRVTFLPEEARLPDVTYGWLCRKRAGQTCHYCHLVFGSRNASTVLFEIPSVGPFSTESYDTSRSPDLVRGILLPVSPPGPAKDLVSGKDFFKTSHLCPWLSPNQGLTVSSQG